MLLFAKCIVIGEEVPGGAHSDRGTHSGSDEEPGYLEPKGEEWIMKTIARSMLLVGVGMLGFGATPARAQGFGFG